MEIQFDFERLEVWQKAVKFAVKVISLMEGIEGTRRHFRLLEQIEASSTSVASNISEGKGRRSDNLVQIRDCHGFASSASAERLQ